MARVRKKTTSPRSTSRLTHQRSGSMSLPSIMLCAATCWMAGQSARVFSPNSLINRRLIPYLSEHRYCAHRSQIGICSVLIKKPAKSSCGTKMAGAACCATSGLEARQPTSRAVEAAAIPVTQKTRMYTRMEPWKPMSQYTASQVMTDCASDWGSSTRLLDKKYGTAP
eukprot:scaffold3852_cov129-Isochrysis_galbana.AAC.2